MNPVKQVAIVSLTILMLLVVGCGKPREAQSAAPALTPQGSMRVIQGGVHLLWLEPPHELAFSLHHDV